MNKEFTSKKIAWNGPDGYRIVHAKDDKYTNSYARLLKSFFKKTDGVELEVVDDSVAPTEKEILVGDTNRYKTSLTEQQFAVTLIDGKLVFEGGHRVMVEKAVKWFMTFLRTKGTVDVLSGEAKDFTSKMTIGGEEYIYVWGDEFDGDFLDKSKLVYHPHMGDSDGGPHGKVLADDPSTLRVEDGQMKMFAYALDDPSDPDTRYVLPECVCTNSTMWWLYGYAEIRAKVPYQKGCWPAWWATSFCDDMIGKTDDWKYLVEIDFFEIFGNETDTVPNIHKWYKNYAGYFTKLQDENGKEIIHTEDMGTHHVLPAGVNNSDEYHTYGFRWTPDTMTMSVNGEEYMTYDLNHNFDGQTDMEHFKVSPLHMIFDNWLFLPGSWEPRAVGSNHELPSEFFVDYMRIYQKPGEGYLIDTGVDKEIE